MKNRSTCITGILCFLSIIATAQNKTGKISGVITDADAQAVESATASLQRAKDSALVKVAVSDKYGLFEFDNLAEGEYFVTVTAVGFNKQRSKPFKLSGTSPYKLPSFQLQKSAAKTLGEVTVTGKRPLIENKIDRMVVNVEAAPTNAGASALEVLEKSPGVTVSNEGEISLKGKQGVRIMIDGKPTYLSPADLANLLKNLPASALDQIEIMTNPPARYEASGNSGIINIKTKKSLNEGLNGSITIGGTVGFLKRHDTWYSPVRGNSSLNLNYRKGKWNLFGNFNYNYREGKGNLDLTRRFFEKDGSLNSTSASMSNFSFRGINQTVKMGFDYYANKKNVFGVVVNGFGFFGRPAPQSIQTISRADGSTEQVLNSRNINKNNFFNYSANFNYKHTFDSAGRELTADLDYIGYNNNAKNTLITDIYDGYGNALGHLTLFGDIPGIINIYSAKSDYVHPLKNNLRFDAGFKVSYVKNDNEVKYERNNDGTWKPDDRSNHFIYQENINAAYVSLNKKWKKWSGQAGLRMENTVAKGKQVTNDSTFTRNYTSLFPTMYVNYEVNKSHTFTLSYGRRIERPNYQDLNPFIWFLDSLQYRQGNPYLLPQYANNFELRHTLKGKYTTTINYTITDDVISQLLKQNTEKRITFLTADNVARFKNIGLAINAPFTVVKNWNVNLFVNVFNNRYEGVYYNSFTGKNDPIDISYTSALVNVSNTFSFKKGWSGEVSGFYRGKTIEQLTIADPMYFMNLGVQKTVIKGKGTVRLNIRDPFHWQQFKGRTLYSDIDVKIYNRWDNRNITATFSYRFGKTSIAQARKRNNGASEEQNRAGGGQQ
ncbi:TonB-dependent receptor domain-containing protein [Niastella sp. OAS944]|uniref:TonB-dependent receptor domain-containing protein n=1 Tax=Niastella sp. OAS944 TaxID=2664089 RepID=UPI00348D7B7C|nr:outer membrane receptor protein involved in Fe transport [Chitinophagaceae bacterium OAS944]